VYRGFKRGKHSGGLVYSVAVHAAGRVVLATVLCVQEDGICEEMICGRTVLGSVFVILF
jgi:hypothetical protein